jgi:hypothetical protein
LLPVYDAGGTAARTVESDQLRERLLALGTPAEAVSLVPSLEEAGVAAWAQLLPGAVEPAVVVMGARDPGLPILARGLAQSRIAAN